LKKWKLVMKDNKTGITGRKDAGKMGIAYGGQSHNDTACLIELYNLLAEDRMCRQAEVTDMELRTFCSSRKERGEGSPQEEGAGMVVEQEALNDDQHH
jgi:hypothetical protein